MSDTLVRPDKRMLKPVLGIASLLSVAVGVVVGQGAIVSVLQGIGLGGTDFMLVLLVGFFIAMCNASSFAELSLMMPRAGGLSTYTEVAIGHFPAIVATFSGYVVVAMFGLSAELLLVGALADQFFSVPVPPAFIACLIIGIFALLNIFGTDIFASTQNFMTFVMVVVLLVVGLVALTQSGATLPQDREPFGDWEPLSGGFLGLMTLGIWAYMGLEFVCPMVEEIKNPQRDIPRSMFLGAGLVLVVYSIFALGAGTYLSRETLASSPIPHLDYAVAVFGSSAKWIIIVIALTASCSTVNTVLASVSRMLYGMAQNGQIPSVFKTLHPRFRTPWVAILFMGVVTCLPLVLIGDDPDAIITLLIAASSAWLLAYIIAHIDLIVLRRRMPDAKRPFRSPFYPLPQILGIVAMGYLILNNSPTPEMTQKVYTLTGIVLLIVTVAAILWVKLVMKQGLFEPQPFENS